MDNPLLISFSLPPFTSINHVHIIPAIKIVLNDCRRIIEQVLSQQPSLLTWDNFCQPLAEADNRLSKIWSTVSHLNAVKNSKELRKAYEIGLSLMSDYSTWVGQHKALYEAYLNLRNSQHYLYLNHAQKKAIDNTLRDFELSGIKLSIEKQERYKKIVARLSELSSHYSNNVLDATMNWSKLINDKKKLSGIPENTLTAAHAKAKSLQKDGWLLTLDAPSYLSVITYCDDSALREEIYYAYNTRASDKGPNAGKWDNGPIMNEILALRHEIAQLLGFHSYADKSLVTKMAKKPQQVLDFLKNLVKRSRPKGKNEVSKLYDFVKLHYNINTLKPWDIAYYSEKQKQYLFSINDEQLRPYFPESRVINSLFEIIKRIYGITAKNRTDVDVWHPDVSFFDLFNEQGKLCGSFYLDLYSRNNKREGAWMDECINMMRKDNGKLQKPVAYITCNFTSPINGKPSLLTHNEVITLFHEFGHGLHHILTCIDTPGVSGISGVPWDAVELPSQLMENYCWQPEALKIISGHYETNMPISDTILNKLLSIKKYQAALFLLRQLELGLFDFYLHYQYQSEYKDYILDLLGQIKKQVSVIPTVSWGRSHNTFSHIFAGSYAAGYYSYLWADVLAADIWSCFEQDGIFNRRTGQLFLDTILSRGGSEDFMVLFSRFRGREPQLDALLHHYGIQELDN